MERKRFKGKRWVLSLDVKEWRKNERQKDCQECQTCGAASCLIFVLAPAK